MENDSIRASGSETLVDIWIDGKMRSICITQEAIGAHLDFDSVARMTDEERCAFVKSNLAMVLSAAKARLRAGDPTANTVVIEAGHLPRSDGKTTDRRKTERRKSERRKSNQPLGGQPDRRRTTRRHGERRARPRKPDA